MSIQMRGAEVAKAMKEKLIREREELNAAGVNPCLTIIRVGAKENDLAYERGAKKRMEMIGIECRIAELPEDISQEEFEDAFCKINKDPEVHGILLFQPLPEQLDVEKIRQMIDPAKDMDGMSPVNLAKIFEGDRTAYAPCTSEAVMHIMNHYGIELQGKRVTVIGRSMVVGKPLSMLGIDVSYTKTGIVVALVFVGIPFVVRAIQPVLEKLDGQYEEAAYILGAGREKTFFRVILPELTPALFTGFGLALARGIGEYGSVIYISGNSAKNHTQVISYVIMQKLNYIDYESATAIALVMLVFSFLILLFVNIIQVRQAKKTL